MKPEQKMKILHGIYSVLLVLFLLISAIPISSGTSLSVKLNYSSTLMDIGQSQVFTVNVSGGVPPYSYQWYINNNTLGISSSSYKFQPASTGNYTFYVKVTDSQGNTGTTNSVTIHVNSAMSVVKQPSPYTTDVNYYSYFSVNISGGSSPFVYFWYVYFSTYLVNITTISSSSRVCNFTYIPTIAGNLTVWVSVKDSANVSLNSSKVYLKVNPMPKPYLAPGNTILVQINEPVEFYGYVNGGTPPYNFIWYVNNTKYTNYSNIFNYTFKSQGNYTVYFVENDSVGYTSSSAIATVYVTSSPLPTIKYSATPQSNIPMNMNMSISISAYSTSGTPMWVLDDVVVGCGENYTYIPSSLGVHVFYAEIPYNYSGKNVSIPGQFWGVNVSSVPYMVSISTPKSSVDINNYIYLNISSLLGSFPVTAYSVFKIGNKFYNYSFVLYSSFMQVSIPVQANYTGTGTFYVYSTINSSENYIFIHSNTLTIKVNSVLSNLTVNYKVLWQGQDRVLINFTCSFSGGTAPYKYSWKINNLVFNVSSMNSNMTFGSYNIALTIKDYYGQSLTYTYTLNLYPPNSTIIKVSGVNKYNGIFYMNTSKLSFVVNTTSFDPMNKINYAFYNNINGSITYISNGSVSQYSNVSTVNVNGIKEYIYTYKFSLVAPKEGNYYLALISYDSIGLSSSTSIPIVYNTEQPIIGNILPALSFVQPNINFYFNNITYPVPILKIVVMGNFPNGTKEYLPPFKNTTFPLPPKNGYYNISVKVILVTGIFAVKNYTVYLDLIGVPFKASVVSYNGNEVVISISIKQVGGSTPAFYRVSTNPNFAGAQWKPFSSSISIPVSADQGTIYIQIKDSNGVVTSYSVQYALPPPAYMQYLWVIIILPILVILIIFMVVLLRRVKAKQYASSFSPVDLSNVDIAQKEKYFLEELYKEGSPRVKEFKKLLKAKYSFTEEDFDKVSKSLIEKKKIVIATDEEKKARIYPVMEELGDLTGEKNTSQPNQTEQDNQTDNQNSNQQ